MSSPATIAAIAGVARVRMRVDSELLTLIAIGQESDAILNSLLSRESGPARQYVCADRVDFLRRQPRLERRHSHPLVLAFKNDLAVLVINRWM